MAGLISVHFATGGGDLVTNTGLLCLNQSEMGHHFAHWKSNSCLF
jgi:hypothetical protein